MPVVLYSEYWRDERRDKSCSGKQALGRTSRYSATHEEFERKRKNLGIVREALKEGLVL